MNLSDAHISILCYAHTHKLTYMRHTCTYRHKCIQIAFMYDHRFHFLCSKLQVQIHNSMMPKCFIYKAQTQIHTHTQTYIHTFIKTNMHILQAQIEAHYAF